MTNYTSVSSLLRVACTLALGCTLQAGPTLADQGDPLAIRAWPGGVVSLESHWNFSVAVNLHHAPWPPQLADADLKIIRLADHAHKLRCELRTINAAEAEVTPAGTSPANVAAAGSTAEPASTAASTSVSEWTIADINLYLDRLENQATQTLLDSGEATFVSKNAVSIGHIAERQLLIAVDGLRVGIPLVADFTEDDEVIPLDVLLLSPLCAAPTAATELGQLQQQVQQWQPRWAIIDETLSESPAAGSWEKSVGNTTAIRFQPADESAAASETTATPTTRWLQLRTQPWEMPTELAELFERKEAASRHTQQVFADLSVTQLNFKPSNGTHTPRWNSEHMMGRELLFFSQIFAQRTPEIVVIDLNPQQMPPDYQARHVDWDGGEEARQLERVSAFTRRFAYLLSGLDLDQPAPGSSWTLRRLLKQMDLHYSEHTANVQKKFALTDWPRREP